MKLLLLGSQGQLGRSILKANENSLRPFEIIAPNRKELDLANVDQIKSNLASHNFDVLINSTGFHDVDEVEVNPQMGFIINAYAVQQLALSCKEADAKMIHISTDFVFGGDENLKTPINENCVPAPVNAYGSTKLTGERLAILAHQNVAIFRVASLFGLGGMSKSKSNFVEAIISKAAQGKKFQVVNDQFVSPTSTEDVASAMLKIVHQGFIRGIYHVVNSGCTSKFHLAKEILKQANYPDLVFPCTSDEFKTTAKRPKFSALDNTLFSSLGMTMPSWQNALNRYLKSRQLK